MVYDFCANCPEGCDAAQAAELIERKTCDPCDCCFNYSSPACLDCGDKYSNYEAATDRDGDGDYPPLD